MTAAKLAEKKSAAFLKAAGVKPRPSQLQLLGDVLGVALPTTKISTQAGAREQLSAGPEAIWLDQAKGIRQITIKNLVPDPNNPRRGLGDVGELASSITKVGVLEPLIVRPTGAPHARGDRFMIVVGHRRRAAAAEAGVKELPCIIRPMSDAQALEIQLIENCQRKDLQPLEEADSYARLISEHQHTHESIAARVGKSKGWVIARLKLRALCPDGKAALTSGRLHPSLAVPVARIKDPKAQARFIERACPKDGPRMPIRAALDLLHEEFARSLKAPPFNPKDANLVPEAGACTTCPRRSGNTPGLTDDLKGHDSCTGPECFDKKAKATWDANVAKYRAQKIEVLPIAKGRSLFRHGNQLVWDGPYVEASAPAPQDTKKRTWSQLISSLPKDKVAFGERVQKVVVADLKMKPRLLYPRDLALRALADFGVKWATKQSEERAVEAQPGAAREKYAQEKYERDVRNRTAQVLVAKISQSTLDVKRPQALLMLELIEDLADVDDQVMPKADRAKEIDGLNLPQLLLRCFKVLLGTMGNAWQGYDERLLELAAKNGLDVKLIENAIKREIADEALAKTEQVPAVKRAAKEKAAAATATDEEKARAQAAVDEAADRRTRELEDEQRAADAKASTPAIQAFVQAEPEEVPVEIPDDPTPTPERRSVTQPGPEEIDF